MPSSTAKDNFERACAEFVAKRTERRGQERLVEKIQAELERKDTEVKKAQARVQKNKQKYEDMKARNTICEDMEDQKRVFENAIKLLQARQAKYTTILRSVMQHRQKLRELETEETVCEHAAEASATGDMFSESEIEAFELEIDLDIAAMEKGQYGLLSQTSGTGSLIQPVSPARTPTPSPTPSQAAGTAALKRYIQSSCPEPKPETEPKPEPETDPKPEPVICSICHDECKDKPISCGHHFHADCILGWTMRGKKECPYCRQKIIPTSFTQHLS